MRLPRLLLLVVVVLVVLAVVGGGVGLVGLGDDETDPRGGLTDFLDGLAPDPPPVELDTGTAPCLSGGQLIIAFNATCDVVVLPTDDLRRALALRVTTGLVHFDTTQVVGGQQVGPSTKDVPFVEDTQVRDEVSVVVSRGDSATLDLRCLSVGGCVLAVDPA